MNKRLIISESRAVFSNNGFIVDISPEICQSAIMINRYAIGLGVDCIVLVDRASELANSVRLLSNRRVFTFDSAQEAATISLP